MPTSMKPRVQRRMEGEGSGDEMVDIFVVRCGAVRWMEWVIFGVVGRKN